jgi:DNA-binding transcriptional ArsR family regulator
MHGSIRWRDGGIEAPTSRSVTVRLDGDGLLFVPSVFVWPGVAVYVEPPWPFALVYPARGIAALWERAVPAPPQALAGVLGRARAQLLTALDNPASTSQLVQLLGLSLGAVGDQLAALRRAGFVARERSGRSVLYRRTPVGDAVIAAASAGDGPATGPDG